MRTRVAHRVVVFVLAVVMGVFLAASPATAAHPDYQGTYGSARTRAPARPQCQKPLEVDRHVVVDRQTRERLDGLDRQSSRLRSPRARRRAHSRPPGRRRHSAQSPVASFEYWDTPNAHALTSRRPTSDSATFRRCDRLPQRLSQKLVGCGIAHAAADMGVGDRAVAVAPGLNVYAPAYAQEAWMDVDAQAQEGAAVGGEDPGHSATRAVAGLPPGGVRGLVGAALSDVGSPSEVLVVEGARGASGRLHVVLLRDLMRRSRPGPDCGAGAYSDGTVSYNEQSIRLYLPDGRCEGRRR